MQAQCWFCPKCFEETYHDVDKCKTRKQLESDSQMLEDLIEMLLNDRLFIDKGASGMYWLDDLIGESNYSSADTPSEAIAAAIKQWRQGK
jgi:hypothetical protein